LGCSSLCKLFCNDYLTTLGLGKIKYDFGSTPAAESQSTTANRTYGVTKNGSDQLVVNVPWLNSSDVNSVTASGATTALSGLSSTPNTGSVVIGLDIHGRASLGTPASDDELMIYDTSTAKNVKVLVSDLASYAGSAATNQVTYWTSANEIGGAAGFTFAGGANGAVTMGGNLSVAGDVSLPDDKKIILGTGNDLQIYHDQNNSFIKDAGTGDLVILSDTVSINNAANSENIAKFLADSAVKLYYDNVQKFQTTSTGIEVSGTVSTFSGDVVSNAIVQANGFRTTTGSTDYSLLTRNSSNTAVYIQQAGSGNIVDFRYGSQAAGQGTSAMLINASGYVGIGTDPDYTLHLLKSSGDTEMYINGQNGQSSLRMGLDARNWQIKTAAAPYLWSLNYVGTDVPLSNIITATVGGNVGMKRRNRDGFA